MSSDTRQGASHLPPLLQDPPQSSDNDEIPELTQVSDSSDDEYIPPRDIRAATVEDDTSEDDIPEYADDDGDSAWETESDSGETSPPQRMPGSFPQPIHSRANAPSRRALSPPERNPDSDDLPALLSVSDSSDIESDTHSHRSASPTGSTPHHPFGDLFGFVGAGEDDEESDDNEDDLDVATAAARFAVRRRRPLPSPFNFTPNQRAREPNPDAFVPDLRRAKQLLEGLELVSQELLVRFKNVQGGEEDAVICAICHDSLVQDTPGSPSSSTAPVEEMTVHSLPCRHLFHTHCVTPWLGIKTTCPTCRFDLDPHPHVAVTAIENLLSTREDLEIVLRVLGQNYWSRVNNIPFDEPEDESDDEDDSELPALEPISVAQQREGNARPTGDAEDWDEQMPPLEPVSHTRPMYGVATNDEWDAQMPPLEPISEGAEAMHGARTASLPSVDIRPSLLTPISSRAQTLESPIGEQLHMDQIRWPPGRSNSVGSAASPGAYQADPHVLDIHGPRLLREAIARRSLMQNGNAFQVSPPSSVLSLGGTTTRASTMPDMTNTNDAHTDGLARRSHTLEGSGSRSSPRSSPLLGRIASRLSPQSRSPELVPVAPLLGVLQTLPPISPDQPAFPHAHMQEEPEEAPIGAWDYLTPSAGVSSAGIPSDRDMRETLINHLESIFPRHNVQGNSAVSHPTSDEILLDSPPLRMTSPVSPTSQSTNAHALLSETFRRLRSQANLTAPPHVEVDGTAPESFTFGTTAPRHDEQEGDATLQESSARPRRKWARPPGQSFQDWIEQREAAAADNDSATLDLMGVD